MIFKRLAELLKPHSNKLTGFVKFIGPGLLVTVGFIDPGNWASNLVAGSSFGYSLLWVVTLSTIMLIFLQHNVAHIGIVTGKCLAEATKERFKPPVAYTILGSSVIAVIATAFAELLGGAIAIKMLFKIPIQIGAVLVFVFVLVMLFTSSYKKLEKIIVGFVSLIGISFLIELFLINIDFKATATALVLPQIPFGSATIILSVLGAVVMPHNLFLHSEIIQNKQINKQGTPVIEQRLKTEFADTVFSMIVGWAINSAMIIIAAAVFFTNKIPVTQLEQAQDMLVPMLSGFAGVLFAFALFCSGIASAITVGIAGGSIFSGIFGEAYNIKDIHTKLGIALTMTIALIAVFCINNTLNALVWSQILLSVQLPITVITQLILTSDRRVMGKYVNRGFERIMLYIIGVLVIFINIYLLYDMIK